MINDLLDPTGQNLRVREDAQVCSLLLEIKCIISSTMCCFFIPAVDLIRLFTKTQLGWWDKEFKNA